MGSSPPFAWVNNLFGLAKHCLGRALFPPSRYVPGKGRRWGTTCIQRPESRWEGLKLWLGYGVRAKPPVRGHRHANSKRTGERGTKTKPFPSKEISAPGAARNRDCRDTEMNFYKWRLGWKTRRGHPLLAPGFLENRLSRYTLPSRRGSYRSPLPLRVFPHPPLLSQSALLLNHIKANLFKATVQNCVSNPRPKPNPSSLREFRPADFWTDGIKGAGNRKVQVVGRGTGRRESQSEFQWDDFYCCITSWVDVQVLESLGLYQTCVFKYKDFHLCAEIGSLLHSLDLDIRILILTSDFSISFFWRSQHCFGEDK